MRQSAGAAAGTYRRLAPPKKVEERWQKRGLCCLRGAPSLLLPPTFVSSRLRKSSRILAKSSPISRCMGFASSAQLPSLAGLLAQQPNFRSSPCLASCNQPRWIPYRPPGRSKLQKPGLSMETTCLGSSYRKEKAGERERQSEREAQGVCSRSVGCMLGIPVSVFHRWHWEESYESEQSLKPVA